MSDASSRAVPVATMKDLMLSVMLLHGGLSEEAIRQALQPFDDQGNTTGPRRGKPHQPVVTFRKPTPAEPTDCAWTDWLLEDNWDKYHALCLKHFGNQGQLWFDREPASIEAWLSDYLGKPVVLLEIQHHVNASSWHHLWFFAFASA